MGKQTFVLWILMLGAFDLVVPALARADTRALIVGVSDYPGFAETMRLKGPKNDAREFANTIVRLGVPPSNVTVLADGAQDLPAGVHAPGPGVRTAILDGLAALAETSKTGDLVVFYFSGHGSQQPDTDGDEQGGQDEVFLPFDTAESTGQGRKNAIVDDELRAAIDAIRARGADVFAVIDACHSATGFRAIGDETVRVKQIPPITPTTGKPAERSLKTRSVVTGSTPENWGRAAFFYAAQESEKALDMAIPGAGQNFSLFTYALLKRMNETPDLTYRALHQSVMADIKSNVNVPSQTPDAEGDLLDEPVLNLTAEPRRQWRIFNGRLQAGGLHGVTVGSRVALYADPADPDEATLAYGLVEEASATKAIVVAAPPCGAAEQACSEKAGPAGGFAKARYARIVDQAVDLSVSISEPVRVDPQDGHDYTAAREAFRRAIESNPIGRRLSVRTESYDLAVGLVDGTLAFDVSAGLIDSEGPGSSPRITLPDDPNAAAQTTAETLKRIGKAIALQRLGADPSQLTGAGLETTLLVAKAKSSARGLNACLSAATEADFEPIAEAGDAPVFDDCDRISLAMENRSRKALDVTALLIGRDFSITTVWPLDGVSGRILPSEEKTASILYMQQNPETASNERLVVIAVPGVNQANVVFNDLQQPGVRAVAGDAPEIAAIRKRLQAGLNDTSRSTVSQARRVEDEMTVSIMPFYVRKDGHP